MINNNIKMETYIKEKRLHPRKYYYLKYPSGDAQITSHPNSKNKTRITYYKIDRTHNHLINFIKKIETNLEQYESHFKDYAEAALKKDSTKTDELLSILITDIEALHPFFKKHTDEILCFLQNCLLHYLKETHTYYIQKILLELSDIADETLKVDTALKKLQDIHNYLQEPIITYSSSEYKVLSKSNLWLNFLDAINTTSENLHKTIKYLIRTTSIKNIELIHPNIMLFHSLFELKYVLVKYIYEFSDILINTPNLTKAQCYCLFFTHHGHEAFEKKLNTDDNIFKISAWTSSAPNQKETHAIRFPYQEDIFTRELKEQRIITAPDEIYNLLVPSVYHSTDNPSTIYLDDENLIFDKRTGDAYTKLCALTDNKNLEERQKELEDVQSSLNSFLSPKLDEIFNIEIHEFYRFEQLIYMELLEMVKNKFFIRKCSFTDCEQYFASNNRIRKYCPDCSSDRKSADTTYNLTAPLLKELKQSYYNKYDYQIGKLDSERQIAAKQKRLEWCAATSELIKKYISEGRSDDVESFKDDLKSLDINF